MKKILILFVVLFSLISVERLHTVEDTEQICELLLKNVDAMASDYNRSILYSNRSYMFCRL